jgi:hypothetical protein
MASDQLKDSRMIFWMMLSSLAISIAALCFDAKELFAGETTTTVTTYVVRTQEERSQTRWTLTEWLRIKERMKLMDVWLAMFSDPKQSKFSPELNVSYLTTRSDMRRRIDDATTTSGTGSGYTAKAQVWMTNLISSKAGIRTLNVDLGFEAGGRDSGILTPASDSTANGLAVASIPAEQPSAKTNWYTFDLRLFGKHIQDSSLVLKYGLMQTTNSFQLSDATNAPQNSHQWNAAGASGQTLGAELQLYLTSALGVEGSAHQYRATSVAYSDHSLTGTWGEGLVFIEIGILRLQGGIYEERWRAIWPDSATETFEHGYAAGLKVLL